MHYTTDRNTDNEHPVIRSLKKSRQSLTGRAGVSLAHEVHTSSEAHLAASSVSIGGSFSGE